MLRTTLGGGGGETDVCKGKAGEEEVDGYVEMRVRDGGQVDEKVSRHCDEVHGEKKQKSEWLQFWLL